MPIAHISGSFAYGLGDGLGYIVICYICAGAIKRSKSLRMFRLYCLTFFIEYFVISGVFSLYFNYLEGSNKFLAFGVVLFLVSFSLLLMPLSGIAPKEIAYTLKVSYYTVLFHQKNLYRKLGVQSRAELFARYSAARNDYTG